MHAVLGNRVNSNFISLNSQIKAEEEERYPLNNLLQNHWRLRLRPDAPHNISLFFYTNSLICIVI